MSSFYNSRNDFDYVFGSDASVIITGYKGVSPIVKIPSYIEEKPVTKIGYESFCHSTVTEVFIPENVTSIAPYAFEECSLLHTVYFPKTLEEIEEGAFKKCKRLKNIHFNEGLKYIHSLAFTSCSATTLNIPSTVSCIGQLAFYNSEIRNLNLGTGVKTIYAGAFSNCSFSSLIIPDSTTNIYAGALDSCSNLKSIHIGKNLNRLDDCDDGFGVLNECFELKEITVDAANKRFVALNNILYEYSAPNIIDGLIRFPSKIDERYVVIPKDVESISDGAFNCFSMNVNKPINIKFLNGHIDISNSGLFNSSQSFEYITITCPKNSMLEKWCRENSIRYRPLMSEMEEFFNNKGVYEIKSRLNDSEILI